MEMASGNSISLPSPQTAAGGDQRLQSEIFYLIVRHLRSFDSLKESANDLEAKLVRIYNYWFDNTILSALSLLYYCYFPITVI